MGQQAHKNGSEAGRERELFNQRVGISEIEKGCNAKGVLVDKQLIEYQIKETPQFDKFESKINQQMNQIERKKLLNHYEDQNFENDLFDSQAADASKAQPEEADQDQQQPRSEIPHAKNEEEAALNQDRDARVDFMIKQPNFYQTN